MSYSYHFVALHERGGAPLIATTRKYEMADWFRAMRRSRSALLPLVTIWRCRNGEPGQVVPITEKDLFGE